MRHPQPADLALYAAGDLPVWPRIKAAVHLRTCGGCRELVDAFRMDRGELQASAGELPEGLDWDRLAAEMTANIHLGLAAGECVSPAAARAPQGAGWGWNWRPAAIVAGLMLVMAAAWWLNMPRGDTAALNRVAKTLWSRGPFGGPAEEPGVTVETSEAGMPEFHENGRSLGVGLMDQEPVSSTLNLQGSASAQYVDDDTGVTIMTVSY